MDDLGELLLFVSRLALVPVAGYGVIGLARRWPRATMTLLLALIAAGAGGLSYAARDGLVVRPDSRKMQFHSDIGRSCFAVGALMVTLGVPALPLVAIARARNGAARGPLGGQWMAAIFGYFMACAIFGMVLYSWLTGIVK